MRKISEVLSQQELQRTSQSPGSPASIKDDTTRDVSVDDEQLEKAYRNVPAVFNSINKIYQTIMSRDRTLDGARSNFYADWLSSVGDIGNSTPWSHLHSKIYKYKLIYGQAFIEIIRDQDTGEPVDLAFVDPKKMDYAREGTGGSGRYGTGADIALDRFQNPIGYVQEVDYYEGDQVDQIYEVPDNVSLSQNEIYIPADSMAHFKLYETGEGFYPIGLIDPVFKDAERSFQLKQDYADTAHINLFPTRVAYVGDDTHEATPEDINNINSQMKDAKHSTEWTFADYVEMDMLEAENPEALLDFFNHFNQEISAGMGIAHAIAMGQGEDVNRATLSIQDRMFQISLRDMINRTSRNIEKQIFSEIADFHGHDSVPQFEWDTDVPLGFKGEPDTDSIDSNSGEPVTKTVERDTNEQRKI
jgi:hypothetical protein